MAAKSIQISSDDITYYTLPGNSGEVSREGATIDDTIFGQTWKSGMTGILGWAISANAIYKGYPGYITKMKKQGTSTAMTAEAAALVSGKTYQITNTAKRIINRAVAVTVFDNAVDHTADVISIDFLFGKVTFASGYTVTGAVTITGEYFPTLDLAKGMSYNLTQTANAIRTTDFPTAQANDGYNTHIPGLRTVTLEVPAVFSAADAWEAILAARDDIIVEINPDGISKSFCRGYFKLLTDRRSGNVGELEEENLSFSLNVPIQASGPILELPFSWAHAVDSPIPTAIRKCLDAYIAEQTVYVKYLPDGVNGFKGTAVVTNMSLSGGMETANTFAVGLTGNGAMTAVP
jgi:hypothetical protein